MTSILTALERAFALAKSGDYAKLSEIAAQLKSEGYSNAQLDGPSLKRQLRELCVTARSGPSTRS